MNRSLRLLFTVATLTALVGCASAPTTTASTDILNNRGLTCHSIGTRIAEVATASDILKSGIKHFAGRQVYMNIEWSGKQVNSSNMVQIAESMLIREAMLTRSYLDQDCSSKVPAFSATELVQKIRNNETLESFS